MKVLRKFNGDARQLRILSRNSVLRKNGGRAKSQAMGNGFDVSTTKASKRKQMAFKHDADTVGINDIGHCHIQLSLHQLFNLKTAPNASNSLTKHDLH